MSSTPILYQSNPLLPFKASLTLPHASSSFRVNVFGQLSYSPKQFAINIMEGNKVLLHFNPRWGSENKTILNDSHDNGVNWGEEEYAFFPTLTPGASFNISITSDPDYFWIQVNREEPRTFRRRIQTPTASRAVSIDKVEQSDVQIATVEARVTKAEQLETPFTVYDI